MIMEKASDNKTTGKSGSVEVLPIEDEDLENLLLNLDGTESDLFDIVSFFLAVYY